MKQKPSEVLERERTIKNLCDLANMPARRADDYIASAKSISDVLREVLRQKEKWEAAEQQFHAERDAICGEHYAAH